MGRPLEPDVVAIRAIRAALEPLDAPARTRVLEYVASSELNLKGFTLDAGRTVARQEEALRWIRRGITEAGYLSDLAGTVPLIDRLLSELSAPSTSGGTN